MFSGTKTTSRVISGRAASARTDSMVFSWVPVGSGPRHRASTPTVRPSSARRAMDSASARAGSSVFRDVGDPVRVPGIALVNDLVMARPALTDLGQEAEGAAAAVVGEDVVGDDMAEPVGDRPLTEVDLLAVAGREGLVEGADEVDDGSFDVDAVPDPGRDLRPQSPAAGSHPTGRLLRRQVTGQSAHRVVAVWDRHDGPVIGQRRRRRYRIRTQGRRGQPVEPFRPTTTSLLMITTSRPAVTRKASLHDLT